MLEILASSTTQVLSELGWLTLFHSLWIGLLTGSVVATADSLLPPGGHETRRTMALSGLIVVIIGSPFVAVVHLATGRIASPIAPYVEFTPAQTMFSETAVLVSARTEPKTPAPARWTEGVMTLFRRTVGVVEAMKHYVILSWSAVVIVYMAVLTTAALSLCRLRRSAVTDHALQDHVRPLVRRLRLTRVPAIQLHRRLDEPCLAGVVHPVILLPLRWRESADPSSLDAVLAHELAHAKRGDHWMNLLLRGIEACFFFHPCVHWLSRAARRESEHCADALAARLTDDPLALARSLESFARLRMERRRRLRIGLAVGGDRASLLPRIQELLGMTPSRPRLPLWPFAAVPASIMVALISASIGIAQELTDKPEEVPSTKSESNPSKPYIFDVSPERFRELMLADPHTLSTEDLVRRVRGSGVLVGTGAETDRANLLELATSVQISFEVQLLEVEDDLWKSAILDAIVPFVEGDPNIGAWLVREKSVQPILESLQKRGGRKIQFPKVTSFEGATATLTHGGFDAIRASNNLFIERINSLHAQISLPIPKNSATMVRGFPEALDGSSQVQLTGYRESNTHRVHASLKTGFGPHAENDTHTKDDGVDVPTSSIVVDRSGQYEVPDGMTLVLDSGVALTLVDKKPTQRMLRHLVLITPRHIQTEAEEAALETATQTPESR